MVIYVWPRCGHEGVRWIRCFPPIDCIYGYLRLTTLWSWAGLGCWSIFHRLHLWLFMFDHVVVRKGVRWIRCFSPHRLHLWLFTFDQVVVRIGIEGFHWGLYVSHIVIHVWPRCGHLGVRWIRCFFPIDCIYGYWRLTTLWSVGGEVDSLFFLHRFHLWLFTFDHVVVGRGEVDSLFFPLRLHLWFFTFDHVVVLRGWGGFVAFPPIDCIYGYLRLTTLWSGWGEVDSLFFPHRLHLWLFTFDHVVVGRGIWESFVIP